MAAAGLAEVRGLLHIPMPWACPLSETPRRPAGTHKGRRLATRGIGPVLAAYDKVLESDRMTSRRSRLAAGRRAYRGPTRAGPLMRSWLDRKGCATRSPPTWQSLARAPASRRTLSPRRQKRSFRRLANTRPPERPAPLFRFLKHTHAVLRHLVIASAATPDQQSEAHVVIGLDLLTGRADRRRGSPAACRQASG